MICHLKIGQNPYRHCFKYLHLFMHISTERVHGVSCVKRPWHHGAAFCILRCKPICCPKPGAVSLSAMHYDSPHTQTSGCLTHTHTHTQLNAVLQVCYCSNVIHGQTDCGAAHRPMWHCRLINRPVKIEWRRRLSLSAAETRAWVTLGCTEGEG